MRTSCPLRRERNTSSDGTARPLDCSSSDRSLPRSELPGTYGRPWESFTTGLSDPPISSEPLPAPTCRPVSQCSSPSRISLPTSFNSVCAVCALMLPLFVVCDDGLEQVLETFVAALIVLPRDLEQQFLELVQAAQPVPRDRIRQARAQHDEFVLALVFRRSHGAAHGAVKTPQLALGARIHIAHAADNSVRLVVQVQTVGDQLLQFDLRRPVGTPAAVPAVPTPVASVAAISTVSASTAFTFAPRLTIAARPGFRPSRFRFRFLFLCHA